jgi:hypothetical protein
MNDYDRNEYTPLSDSGPRTGVLDTKDIFVDKTKKLGSTAMSGIANIRNFFQSEVAVPRVSQWLNPRPSTNGVANKDSEDQSAKLKQAASQAHQVLANATAVFPFDLFPNEIVLDRTKITIRLRKFFMTEKIVSVRIEDVLNVSVSLGPLFGTLTISSRVMNSTDHFDIGFLRRKEAMYLKKIIQGYVIAEHDDMKVGHLSKEELIKTLCEIGEHANV